MSYHFKFCTIYFFFALLFSIQPNPERVLEGFPIKQGKDKTAACLEELRGIWSVLFAIKDTTTSAQIEALADKNMIIVNAMIKRLERRDIHLNEQWLTTFQDLRSLVSLNSTDSSQEKLEVLYNELNLKFQGSGNQGPGGLVQVAAFQEMSEVTIRGVSTTNYRPTYRVHYVRCNERLLRNHRFNSICKSDSENCQTKLTPCFYLFWAVDIDLNRVCSDSISVKVSEGLPQRIDLHLKSPRS